MNKSITGRRGASLRTTFLIAIALAWIVVGGGSYLAFTRSAAKLSAEYAAHYSAARSELERNRILSLVDRELVLSRKFAAEPDLIAWMTDEGNPRLKSKAIACMAGYRSFLRDGACFVANLSSLSYTAQAKDGSLKVTTLDPKASSDRWFFTMLNGEANWLLNVNHDVILGENRVWINVLVRDIHGRILGVAGAGLDLSSFVKDIVEGNVAGSETIIVDQEGRIQASRDLALVVANAEAIRDEDKAEVYGLIPDPMDRLRLRQSLASAALGGMPGAIPIGLGATKTFLSIGPLPEMGWYSLVFVDASSVMGLRDFLPFGIVTLVSLLLVLLGVLAVLNRLVIEPIGHLTKAAAQVAAGAYDLALPPASRNEIGSLTASFGIMTTRIRDYTEGLEAEVAARTAALVAANEKLASDEKRILDSIDYARLIQDSIFPLDSDLRRLLSGHFLIARPRDLVGGDFVYFRAAGEGFWLGVVDCTGHGVPGAFMTMMVKALLDGLISQAPASARPSAILAGLDAGVRSSLSRESELGRLENGLDIALCHYRRAEDILDFSGAGLGLYVQAGEGLEEIQGARVHLGFASRKPRAILADHGIEAARGRRFYLVSDGVLDLPGAEGGHGFGRTRLKELIARISGLDLAAQGRAAAAALDAWMGESTPRDDLTFLGFGL